MVISNVSVWGRGECDPSSGRGECELEVGANVNLVPSWEDDSFALFQWPGGCATSQARGGAAGGRGPGHSESREGSL